MKILKETANSSSFVMVEADNSIIASGPHSVATNRDGGVFINGPLSISSSVDNVKFAGMFRINPLTASGLPSTMMTPIPTFVIEPPIKGITSMTAVASLFASLV